jgi:hypothetical protein
MVRCRLLLAFLFVLVSRVAAAQAYAPVVTMTVTLPDGRTQKLTAPESGLATLWLKDDSEYGFRPTIQDSAPWNRIVITIFKTATTSAPTTILGEVDLRRGGALGRVQDQSFVQDVFVESVAACSTDRVVGNTVSAR